MLQILNKRFVQVISTLVISTLIATCSGETWKDKEYVYYNYCKDWQNTTFEPIPCKQDRGLGLALNVSSSEIKVVTLLLPPVDPIVIDFHSSYLSCVYPNGAVSKTLYYSFSNPRPSKVDNDGGLKTENKTVIERPFKLKPTIIYIGIEGEQDLNTICFLLTIGPKGTISYGTSFSVSKYNDMLIPGEVSGYTPKYFTLYNPERGLVSVQLFQITFTNITIGGFYSFTKKDPNASDHDGVLSTNNETTITWPSSLLSRKTYEPVIYFAIENIKEAEGNSKFWFYINCLDVKTVQESPGFWARLFGWLG